MSFEMFKRGAAFLALAAGLMACGNDPYRKNLTDSPVYQSIFKKNEVAAPGKLTDQQIAGALAGSPLPMIFFEVTEREAQSLLVRIEQNGPYDTYASAERQAITLRHGLVTATRGLGGDLMSVDNDKMLELVRSGGTGDAIYVQRFLTAESVTEVLTYRCGVEPDKQVEYGMGLVGGVGLEMVAACTSEDGPPFVDYFVVDGGEIVASRQWLGSFTGYIAMHRLRF